ncbi:MAG: glutamate-cysteine ligase family protein [Gemmatimonadota bacterium]|nr:glutamate-cysteine ligase family protein [Gemmatimonadota bacterium]
MSLTEAKLLEDLQRRFFSPMVSRTPRAIGVELELIPVHVATRLPALTRSDREPSTVHVLSQLGKRHGWRELSAGDDPPSWKLQDGTSISFEPGGQIEISSAAHPNASSVALATRTLVAMIREAMTAASIDVLAFGVDPYNGIEAVPLQLHRDRYDRMTRYFESIGPSGVRMMRQTAAVQLNVERGDEPGKRWVLLNALAPYIVALFANSRTYAGKGTGHASYRAHLWRTLDPSRTGLPCDFAAPAARYLAFALDAMAMQSSDGTQPWLSFRDWMQSTSLGDDDWLFHLSTLFPEVRPKEFFEIRSPDAVGSGDLAAPVVFIAGIVYDTESAAAAAKLAGTPSEILLERAGRLGLADPEIGAVLPRLVEFALEGAGRLGDDYLSPTDVSIARKYFARTLRRTDI